MLIFDLGKDKFECYSYPEEIPSIFTLCYQDDKLWITGKDGKLYVWDISKGEICKCISFPEDIVPYFSDIVYFGTSFIFQNVLWLFPISTDVILKYNIDSETFEQLRIEGEEEEKEGETAEPGRFFQLNM